MAGNSHYETGLTRDERFILNKMTSDIIQNSDENNSPEVIYISKKSNRIETSVITSFFERNLKKIGCHD